MYKSLCISVISLLALSMAAYSQAPDPTNVGKMGKTYVHYAHGYNKSSTTVKVTPREDRDSVMVGAEMLYFVKPDPLFNAGYASTTFATSDDWVSTANLAKVKSTFEWKVPSAIGALAAASTSPKVSIKWNTAGLDTVRIIEHPTEFKGVTLSADMQSKLCAADTAKIPVTVINQPSVQFGTVNISASGTPNEVRMDVLCPAADPATTPATYDFPLEKVGSAVIDETGKLTVYYTIAKDNGTPTTAEVTLTGAAAATLNLPLSFDSYGSYVVTITGISDRISVKCALGAANDGIFAAAAGSTVVPNDGGVNSFNLLIMPKVKAQDTYHISNDYTTD